MEAFVYCWTDKTTNKLYVGSHRGPIDDGYVCSSKYMMREYNERPQDFSRQIVAQGSHADMRKFEAVILQSVNAKINEDFYNKHNNDGFYFDGWQKGQMSEEHRRKLSEARKKRFPEGITKEHAAKLHAGRRASTNSSEHAAAVIASRVGSKHSEDSKAKMRKTRLANQNTKKLSSNAGKVSQKKRIESGYYQTEEWREKVRLGWEKRRANKSKTTGGIR